MSIAGIIAGAKSAAKFLPYAGIAAALVFGGIQWTNAQHWNKRFTAEAAAHRLTKSDTRLAQAKSEIAFRDAVDRERTRYEQLSMKAIQSYEIRSAANDRLVADLLRKQAAGRATGQTDAAGSTLLSASALQPATEAVIPEGAFVGAGDLYAIGAAYAQCDALIDWALGLGDKK